MKKTLKVILKELEAKDYFMHTDNWNGCRVYEAMFGRSGYFGLPFYIIEDNEENARLADCDEVFEIINFLINQKKKK